MCARICDITPIYCVPHFILVSSVIIQLQGKGLNFFRSGLSKSIILRSSISITTLGWNLAFHFKLTALNPMFILVTLKTSSKSSSINKITVGP